MLDQRQADFRGHGLALCVGRGNLHLNLVAGPHRTFRAVAALVHDLQSQVALDREGAGGFVESAEDRTLFRILRRMCVRHHRHGKLKVRRQRGAHRDRQLVRARLQANQLVVQHPRALKRDQRQGRGLAPMDADLRRVADFERVLVRQDPQTHGILVIGDLHEVRARDRVLEAIDAFHAQDVTSALFHAERDASLALLLVGGHFVPLDLKLADLAIHARLLEDRQRKFLGNRLAFGIVRGHVDLKRLARHVYRPDGADGDREALRGQIEILDRAQVSFRQIDDQPQRLRFAEFTRGELEAHLAVVVGPRRDRATVGQLIANLAIHERRAVVEASRDLARDFLPAVVDLAVRFDAQADGLQLILVHLERALVAVVVVVADLQPVGARRAGGGQ